MLFRSPFFHGNAQGITIGPAILADAKAVIVERFSASRLWDDCRRWDCTEANYIGGIIPILLKQEPREEDGCNKYTAGTAARTEGLVLVFCPHRVALGFVVLNKHEGPGAIFEFVRSRMTEAPRAMVYDNACCLHAYCFRRDPAFFARTKFFVDRFHFYSNHVSCCEGYSPDVWPEHTPVLSADDLRGVDAPGAAPITFRQIGRAHV